MAMSPGLKILCRVLGLATFEDADPLPDVGSGYFDNYRVHLPIERFRGLFPDWHFAILKPDSLKRQPRGTKAVLDEAKRLVETLDRKASLFLVSTEPVIRLVDHFEITGKNVFYLDANQIPKGELANTDVTRSPMIGALRRKGLTKEPTSGELCPYVRAKPVEGWRFFGRKRPLREVIETQANLVLVGPRRVGKTSLLQEAKRLLNQRGETVYHLDVQNCTSAAQVSSLILEAISPREKVRAVRHGQALGERVLTFALKDMAHSKRRVTLILDEIGNVIKRLDDHENDDEERWKFLGSLRKYSQQHGNLRIILSCFQEAFIQQVENFDGPLVNFGATLRLEPFSPEELEDFLYLPLEIWKPLERKVKEELRILVTRMIGRHPYFLQFFCEELFRRMMEKDAPPLIDIAKIIVRRDLGLCFSDPVEQVFRRIPSSLLKYCYLIRCCEAENAGTQLFETEIDDDWLVATLARLGYSAKYEDRRMILEGLEIHGLSAAIGFNRGRQRIAIPIIYYFLKEIEPPVERIIDRYSSDIPLEEFIWKLQRK